MGPRDIDRLLREGSTHLTKAVQAFDEAGEPALSRAAFELANQALLARRRLVVPAPAVDVIDVALVPRAHARV